jgi:hypothetical protein
VISGITGGDVNPHITHVVSRSEVATFVEIIAIKQQVGCSENIL